LPKIDPTLASAGAEDFLPNATAVLPLTAEEGAAGRIAPGDDAVAVRVGGATIAMPDFRGMPKRKVMERCQELGLQLQATGSGVAVVQLPLPGAPVPSGETCAVTFARAAPAEGGLRASAASVRAATGEEIPSRIIVRP
jgi:hypothetical protein